MSALLSPEDFPGFFAELHDGDQPFAWQAELVARAVETGSWPSQIDVPTGLGKTAFIDAFVFLAAIDPLTFGRRLFFTIDRRVVVDQAYRHAEAIAHALAHAQEGSLTHRIAERIRPLAADAVGRPLWVERMRGGTYWPWQWVDRADRVAVIVGTAAQVGSRLLFRGFGVSEHRRSIDAALVGTDSVIVVDEAHIARPMLRSCANALGLGTGEVARASRVISMSATVPGGTRDGWTQRLDAANETATARQRLFAKKHLTTATVTPPSKAKANAAVASALAEHAQQLLDEEHTSIGVFCNTVQRARLTFELLNKGEHGGSVALLTGRMREFDRDRWNASWLLQFESGAPRAPDAGPTFLVATQAIEVGADIDLDAIVTESAALDALLQRLGRLNRRGRPIEGRAVVVHDMSVTDDDPVYGAARTKTWTWLSTLAPPAPEGEILKGIDVSPAAVSELLSTLADDERAAMSSPPVTVPLMTPRRLATLARTSPAPVPDLPVTPFLYGFVDSDATVTVVWRTGLPADATDQWPQELGLCPPRPFESIEMPLSAVKRWLAGGSDADQFADTDGAGVPERTESSPPPHRPVAVMRDAPARGEHVRAIDASDIRPNDIVIVPCEYGGLDEFGWTPRSRDATDIGDLRDWRGRWTIRLGPSLRRHLTEAEAAKPVTVSPDLDAVRSFLAMADPNDRGRVDPGAYLTTSFDVLVGILRDEERDLAEKRTAVRQWAASVHDAGVVDERLEAVIDVLRVNALQLSLAEGLPSGTAAVATSTSVDRHKSANLDFAEDDTPHGSSVTGRRIPLAVHQEDVARRARAMAEQLALPERVVTSIEYAARWHDEGKRDPRFQAMLHGGNQFAAELAREPLAKSGMDPADRTAFRIAWQRSKYPAGMRHEALSSQILRRQLEAFPDDAIDDELVTHLVASHHGRSRPLLPPVVDDDPQLVDRGGLGTFDTSQTVDWEAPRRFASLNERYGYWGLALCEAILRLADQNASAAPDLGGEDDNTA